MPKLAQTRSAAAAKQRRAASSTSAEMVLQLIADFQRAALTTVTALRRQSGLHDLLRGWRAGQIAQNGVLEQPRGLYSFHGIGCRFEVNERVVEVNFGPEGRCDGFDAWRLQQYAASAFEWHDVSEAQIIAGLRELKNDGTIAQPGWEPAPELLYLAEEAKSKSSSRAQTRPR